MVGADGALTPEYFTRVREAMARPPQRVIAGHLVCCSVALTRPVVVDRAVLTAMSGFCERQERSEEERRARRGARKPAHGVPQSNGQAVWRVMKGLRESQEAAEAGAAKAAAEATSRAARTAARIAADGLHARAPAVPAAPSMSERSGCPSRRLAALRQLRDAKGGNFGALSAVSMAKLVRWRRASPGTGVLSDPTAEKAVRQAVSQHKAAHKAALEAEWERLLPTELAAHSDGALHELYALLAASTSGPSWPRGPLLLSPAVLWSRRGRGRRRRRERATRVTRVTRATRRRKRTRRWMIRKRS